MNVKTRVMSAWYATASRSNISADVLLEGIGDADRRGGNGQIGRARLLLGRCDPPLDFPDVVQVFAQPRPVARAEPALQLARPTATTESRMLRRVRIALDPLLAACPVPPNSRSNTTRGLISIGSGVVGAGPRDGVHVGAAVPDVARADEAGEVFGRQFEGRERRRPGRSPWR